MDLTTTKGTKIQLTRTVNQGNVILIENVTPEMTNLYPVSRITSDGRRVAILEFCQVTLDGPTIKAVGCARYASTPWHHVGISAVLA